MGAVEGKRPVIMVLRLSALGDVAMVLPAVYSLAARYPQCDVRVVTRKTFGPLFVSPPPNVSLVEVDTKGRHKGVLGFFRLLRLLVRQRADCVADLHNVLRTWGIDLFFLLAGKRVRMVDKKRWARRKITAACGKDAASQEDYMVRYATVFRRLGFPMEYTFRGLSYGEPRALLPGIPVLKDGYWIGVAPFASYPTKVYPLRRMKEVVGRLEEMGCRVFLFGGRGREQKVLESWSRGKEKVHSIPGTLTLPQELDLMSRLDVMVSMDSSNMHMASLAGCPVVSVWGGTTPACGFWNRLQRRERAVCAELPCQPCSVSGSFTCRRGDMACMKAVAPDDIVNKVNDILHER